jgi:mono/diheme cytochrome c family protein
MPAWEKVLTPQQIADLAEYVFNAFIAAPGDSKKN